MNIYIIYKIIYKSMKPARLITPIRTLVCISIVQKKIATWTHLLALLPLIQNKKPR